MGTLCKKKKVDPYPCKEASEAGSHSESGSRDNTLKQVVSELKVKSAFF
jgi:hypothetical protein